MVKTLLEIVEEINDEMTTISTRITRIANIQKRVHEYLTEFGFPDGMEEILIDNSEASMLIAEDLMRLSMILIDLNMYASGEAK